MNADNRDESASRRAFVTGAGIAGVASVLMAASPPASASGGTSISGYFDVTTFGADGTGATGSSTAINNAIAAAAANGGGIVWFPPGTYLLDNVVTVSSQVVLAGAGWTKPITDAAGAPNNNSGAGSWLKVSSIDFTPIVVTGNGVVIRDLAFVHVQATTISGGWVPANYPHAIEVNGSDALLENIFLRNATRGIVIRGALGGTVGRATLKHIWGQPLIEGIRIDNALDVMKIDDVHFWPFWSYYTTVLNYQRLGNSNAFVFQRCDNPHLTNIFAFGYRRGFYFTSSTGTYGGITSRFLMSNCGVDGSTGGIEIDGAGTSGAVVNYYFCGISPATYCGITVNAANVLLQCSNIRITLCSVNGILVGGSGTNVSVESVVVELWNQSGLGFPAIQCTSPATLYLGRSRIFPTASGPTTGGTGTFVMDA